MDNIEELIETALHYLRGIWKNRWIAIAIAWPLMIAGVLYVDQINDRFTAETTVYIDTSSILRPLLKGLAVQTDFKTNVILMSRKLLSTPNLERAARLMDMDINAGNEVEMSKLIEKLKENTEIKAKNRSSTYSITYKNENPLIAKRMVQTLLDIFVEDTLGKSSKQSDTAISFLDGQIKKYDQLLAEAETRLENFKRKNIGIMPGDGAGYYNELKLATAQLGRAKLELQETNNRSIKLKSQLDNLATNSPETNTFLSKEQPRIDQIEVDIENLLLNFTDQHPDVKNKQRILNSLLKKKEVELSKYKNSSNDGLKLSDNPVQQQLQILLGESNALISSLEARVNAYTKHKTLLKNRLDVVPKIEAELARLNRDYTVHKDNYNQLVERREQAKISEEVEAGTDQVKFRIIEPPHVPLKADFPNRPLFDIAVLILSLGVGYGISLLISLTQPIFYNAGELQKHTNLPIIGAITKFDTIQVLSDRRKNIVLFFVANILLILTNITFIIAHSKEILLFDTLKSFGISL